jgi:head-tail adaptor
MTWLANKLRHRVDIVKPVQTPNATTGGSDRTYSVQATVWAGFSAIETVGGVRALWERNVQVGDEDAPTHKFKMRRNSKLGIDFLGAVPKLQGTYWIRLKTENGKARLFRIRGVRDAKERGIMVDVYVNEQEEVESQKPIFV